jgi:hypothetical protein
MVCGGVAAHEVHLGPVFLARLFLKGEPCEVLQLLWLVVATIHRDAAVMLAHLRNPLPRQLLGIVMWQDQPVAADVGILQMRREINLVRCRYGTEMNFGCADDAHDEVVV